MNKTLNVPFKHHVKNCMPGQRSTNPVKRSIMALLIVIVSATSVSRPWLQANAQPIPENQTGEAYQTDATIAEIMESIVMPSADVLWTAVGGHTTEDGGYVEDRPETDEEWQKLRWSAVSLAEATNLLLMPGRLAEKAENEPELSGTGLSPAQIEALISTNRAGWVAHASVLHQTALQTIDIIDSRDADSLFDIGGAIDEACEACHLQFWYPGQ